MVALTMRTLPILSIFLWSISQTSSAEINHKPRQTSFADQCSSFNPADAGVSNATVTNHAFVTAGTSISLPGGDSSCGTASQVVDIDLCRVSLDIATTDRSGVVVEIWMPADWNGRLVTTGNGGLGGCKLVLLRCPQTRRL